MSPLWVEPVGNLIIARLRGVPTEALFAECQARVIAIVHDTGKHCVLYDMLELDPPPVEVAWVQRKLDEELQLKLRRAIVVPDTKLAFLARLAFGAGDHRVFYSDMLGAVKWLDSRARGTRRT